MATYHRSSRFMTAPTPPFAAPCITSRYASTTRRTRCPPSDSNPGPNQPYRATCAAQGQGPPARRRPLEGFSPTRGRGGPQGTFRPTATSRTAPGTVFPWPTARGFCMPHCRSRPCRRAPRLQPPSAVQIRPLGLCPRGLGGALWRLITASSQAKIVSPHAITAHARGGSSHTNVRRF
jgi:hypothetical protein